MLRTPFQDLFKTRYPIIQAGMGPYDTTNLAAAVARAGGLGLISTVGMGNFTMPGIGDFRYSAIFGEGAPKDLIHRAMDAVMRQLENSPDARFGINIPVSEEFIPTAAEVIHAVIERIKNDGRTREKCTAIVTSAGDPLPWSRSPGDRKLPNALPIKEELPEVTWCHVVPSVKAARRCEKAGVDVIIASGREGGAHCSWRDVSSMVLIPEVVSAVKKPVVAAGGFADGRTLAAALALGAVGVQMGTRFIATKESDFDQAWKELLVKATEEDTLVARGFFGPMRFIRNTRAVELVDAAVRGCPDLYKGIPCGSTPEILELEVDGLKNLHTGNIDATPVLGGQAAGRIHGIPTVGELIDSVISEAEATLKTIGHYVR
jgi:enoyl-[acyl-carrier protein] reductase II